MTVFVEKHADGRRIVIIELAIANGSQVRQQEARCEQETDEDEQKHDFHCTMFEISLF